MKAGPKGLVMLALLLSACGGEAKVDPVVAVLPRTPVFKPTSDFEDADFDRNGQLSYREYRLYADQKAAQDEDERFQRVLESAEGNATLQKRFILLDRDGNWQLSPLELGGG